MEASSRIFIRGLPPNLGDKGQAALKKHFSAGGREVTDVKIIPQRRFAFVGFKTPEEAQKAVGYFDRTFLKASRLSVSLAKPVDDASLSKPNKGGGGNVFVPKANAAPADKTDNVKKRKRDEKTKEEQDPKLAEYLKTFQPGKSSANEVAEMLDAAVEEKEKPVPEAESDDEYEAIPARPEKRQMREAPANQKVTQAVSSEAKGDPAESADTPADTEMAETRPDDQPTSPDDQPAAAVTDDDWLRTRTNRLLDLVDDDDEVPVRPPPPPPQTTVPEEAGEPEGQEDPAESPQTPAPETAAEEAPSQDDDTELAKVRRTCRLYVRNLAFATGDALADQQDDLRAFFEQHGEIQEIHIPLTAARTSKGFAFIHFADADGAVAAFQSSGTGTTFQGRLIHVLPASSRRDEDLDEFQISQLPLAKQRKIRKKADASKTFNWNSLYMSQDAVNTAVASRLGVSKADLLDVHDASAAVKQAMAETSVIQETKEYFALHGVDLDAFKSQKKSDDVILVKNIPVTTREELRTVFEQHGAVLQVLMPPSSTIAIVQYAQPDQGKAAFQRLAYSRFKNAMLFLEKAPKGLFKNAPAAGVAQPTGDRPATGVQKLSGADLLGKDEEGPVETTSVFVKNLNFDTTKAGLDEVAKALEGYRGCTVKTKTDPKKPGQVLSLGYGFVAFSSKEAANAAIGTLNGYVLDGHTLQAKLSSRGYDAAEERRKEDKAKKGAGQRTKLIVKNLGFEVTKKDLRSLFTNYGQLRSCRIPQGMGGKSRGFGFVDFKTSREAENAHNALKDTHLLGRRLVVDWAEAELDDPEEQIKAMEAKVRGQTEKVNRAQLTNRTRKKVQIGEGGDDDGLDG